MAEAELREAINQMRAAMESQQTELIALRQAVSARDQQIAELQNASPVSLAGEIRNLVGVLSSRTGSSSDDVVDGKGVGQIPPLANRNERPARSPSPRATSSTTTLLASALDPARSRQTQNMRRPC